MAGTGHFTRRGFVATGAAAASAALVPAPGYAAKKKAPPPSDLVNVAIIGAGGMGAANAAKLTGQNIVALADPDFEHVAKTFLDDKGQPNPERVALKAAYDKAAKYADYRRMFDAQKDMKLSSLRRDHHQAVRHDGQERGSSYVQTARPTVAEGASCSTRCRKTKLVTRWQTGHSGETGGGSRVIRGGVIGKAGGQRLDQSPGLPQGWPSGQLATRPARLKYGADAHRGLGSNRIKALQCVLGPCGRQGRSATG